MGQSKPESSSEKSLDVVLHSIPSLKTSHPALSPLIDSFEKGEYSKILSGSAAQSLFSEYLTRVSSVKDAVKPQSTVTPYVWRNSSSQKDIRPQEVFLTGLAAFSAFQQANITGPPLNSKSLLFVSSGGNEEREIDAARLTILKELDVDGLSIYQHIPHVELFGFAKAVFGEWFPYFESASKDREEWDSRWMRLRVSVLHQRLLALGASSVRLLDGAGGLWEKIGEDLGELEVIVMGKDDSEYGDRLVRGGRNGNVGEFSTETKVKFLLEKGQIYIMQGLEIKARENIQRARKVAGFVYALSGALGRRTKFQQNEVSQLVVFARSNDSSGEEKDGKVSNDTDVTMNDTVEQRPENLELNDDTLLENVQFSKLSIDKIDNSALPPELKSLQPDQQPQLSPLDQITLLTEATLQDTLSPKDKLTNEEILPYALRVLADTPTNWQIYTQALLVRSRIESHRSRTQERSVLQLQVLVDQIVAETESQALPSTSDASSIPEIKISTFLPAPKAGESAPISNRLLYVPQLFTPTRWELESELAYAWSAAGSLISALEIFKRLKLWAEVALCYHAVEQEDKARQVIRSQLFHASDPVLDVFSPENPAVVKEQYLGAERSPPPPHAPRLWCILGDLDQNPDFWNRAWEVSNKRFARAQRSLGGYYAKRGDLDKAREAYIAAVGANRGNGEAWGRLGDIELRMGGWEGAVAAYRRSIAAGEGEGEAQTWSNLGTALVKMYEAALKARGEDVTEADQNDHANGHAASNVGDEDDDEISGTAHKVVKSTLPPSHLLTQALAAYKKGASLAHSNWHIWDNVITLASRLSPPSYADMLLGMRNVIRIRSPTVGEDAIDIDVLRILVNAALGIERMEGGRDDNGVYTPPRGSLPSVLLTFYNTVVTPLITTKPELYTLFSKLYLYTYDYRTALSCAEKAWRIATAGDEWLDKEEGWEEAVRYTESLVDLLEGYGSLEMGGQLVEAGWKGKARSAIRAVMGRGKNNWEGSPGWEGLVGKLDELKVGR